MLETRMKPRRCLAEANHPGLRLVARCCGAAASYSALAARRVVLAFAGAAVALCLCHCREG